MRGPHNAHVVKIDDDHGVLLPLPLPLITAQEMAAGLALQADGPAACRLVQQLKSRCELHENSALIH